MRVSGPKSVADVAESGSAEHSIDDGMGDAITVRMTLQTGNFVGPLESGQPHRPPLDQTVHVGADADPRRCHRSIMPYVRRYVDGRAMMEP